MNDPINSFEENLSSLDLLVKKLESGELTLSEALKVFENGVHLYKACHDTLEAAEMKVKILVDDLDQIHKREEDFSIEDE